MGDEVKSFKLVNTEKPGFATNSLGVCPCRGYNSTERQKYKNKESKTKKKKKREWNVLEQTNTNTRRGERHGHMA